MYRPFGESGFRKELSEEEITKYAWLLLMASEARAYPFQSGYFVKTAGLAEDGTIHLGGNKEFGSSDAFVHGETAIISGMRDMTESRLEAIAWHKKGELVENGFGRPCGKCRDVMLEYAGEDLVLLTGNEKQIIYSRLSDFLFDDFKELDTRSVEPYVSWVALNAARKGVNVYLPEELKRKVYGAVLVSEDGTVWSGSQYTNVGYDAITPVMSAIMSWRNSYPLNSLSEKHLRLKKLVIAGEGGAPRAFYRDRQAILELDEILRIYTGREEPLPVQIAQVADNKLGWASATKAFQTDTEEWLPKPFSPGAFRMDDVMLSQLAQLIGEEEVRRVLGKGR